MSLTDLSTIEGIIAGSAIGAFIAAFLVLAIIFIFAYWIYTSLAWSTIGKKLKYKNNWIAWIPIARWSMILELGRFHWALIFLLLIPILGWIAILVLLLISMWRIYEKLNFSGWLALIPILCWIPFLGWLASLAGIIILGVVAWSNKK